MRVRGPLTRRAARGCLSPGRLFFWCTCSDLINARLGRGRWNAYSGEQHPYRGWRRSCKGEQHAYSGGRRSYRGEQHPYSGGRALLPRKAREIAL